MTLFALYRRQPSDKEKTVLEPERPHLKSDFCYSCVTSFESPSSIQLFDSYKKNVYVCMTHHRGSGHGSCYNCY